MSRFHTPSGCAASLVLALLVFESTTFAQERDAGFPEISPSGEGELCAGAEVEPLLSMSWLDLNPEQEGAVTAERLTLQLDNESALNLRLRLRAHFRVDGRLLKKDLGTHSLAPRERTSLPVDLRIPKRSRGPLEYAAQVAVRAELFGEDGRSRGSTGAPDLYMGGKGAEGLVYTEPLLRRLTREQHGSSYAFDPSVVSVGRGRRATRGDLAGDPTDAPGLARALAAEALGAQATAYNICLRIPVTLDDMTGQPNEVGTDGNWKARGMRVAWVRDPNGNLVAGFPKYASSETGCFVLPASQPGDYDVGIQPVGELTADNRLEVFDATGAPFTYVATFDIYRSGAYVWPYERILPRMYVILAYAIQEGFRGNYDDETLTVWYGESPFCSGCNKACSENTDHSHLAICTGSTQRKFVLAHEYGHANLARSSDGYTNDCSYGDSSHGMRGIEYNSCAAMEGWAHFVAADVWNSGEHSGGDPTGWFVYWGNGNPLIDVEAGQGGCAAMSGDPNGFRSSYADVCFSAGWAFDENCSSGDCDGYGVELDWMRAWWDFHTDDDLAGSRPDHADLHEIVDDATWSASDAWDGMVAALNGGWLTRWLDAGGWNGISEP